MEPEKIQFLKQKISEFGDKPMDVSADFLRITLAESSDFLAKHFIDIIVPNFDRDLTRLGNHLGVRFEQLPNFKYRIIKT